jgi:hypothetical protein
MDLKHIVRRIAQSLVVVDGKTATQRASRTGSGEYIPCIGTLLQEKW